LKIELTLFFKIKMPEQLKLARSTFLNIFFV